MKGGGKASEDEEGGVRGEGEEMRTGEEERGEREGEGERDTLGFTFK
jgi:hypothetical protein